MVFDIETELISVKKETHGIKKFRFRVPQEFDFRPGQFVMLELDADGKKDTRAFSVCSSPARKGYVEIAKKIGLGEYSKALDSMKEKDAVRIRGPFGTFTLDESRDTVMLAGGIGVTPFRCFIEYAADKKLKTGLILFYSNKTPEDIAFREEFDKIERENKNVKIIYTVTQSGDGTVWSGPVGRIDENMIRKFVSLDDQIFYVCGPPAMVDAMTETVKSMGIPDERIRTERFIGY